MHLKPLLHFLCVDAPNHHLCLVIIDCLLTLMKVYPSQVKFQAEITNKFVLLHTCELCAAINSAQDLEVWGMDG